MPRKYKRKEGAAPRGEWTQAALMEAMRAMEEGQLSNNEIARRYGIPVRTLRRRFLNKNVQKTALGKHPALDFDNENLLAAHIQNLEKEGIIPTREMIRKLAFVFAESHGLNVPFNKETRMAGICWLQSFLERHPEVNVQKRFSSALQDVEKRRISEAMPCTSKERTESLMEQDPPDEKNETELEHSDDSDNDPLIKIEPLNDNSNDASNLDLDYDISFNETEIEVPNDSRSKDIVKENKPQQEQSLKELVEVKCDGVDLLFLGYAAAVKKLSRRKQIAVKQEISKIIAEAELDDLE